MSLTDKEVVEAIQRVAHALNLTVDKRRHGGHFCTVHLEAPASMERETQCSYLRQAKAQLEAAGLQYVTLTRFNNPPFKNKSTGKVEASHPRHGDPLIELESVWWAPPTTTH